MAQEKTEDKKQGEYAKPDSLNFRVHYLQKKRKKRKQSEEE